MYRIIRENGELLGFTEQILYAKLKNKTIIDATPEDATAIVHRSVAYNLAGTVGIGANETVSVYVVDGGVAVSEVGATAVANSQVIDNIIISMLKGD